MFLKSNKKETRIETIVGIGTEIEGDIQTSEAVRIDGKIKGSVTAEAVMVGESGVILGDISANRTTVAGKVKGNISASTSLEILSKGQVLGDIRTNKLLISDGAKFEGNCQMVKTDGQVIEINPDSQMVVKGEIPSNGKNLKVLAEKKA